MSHMGDGRQHHVAQPEPSTPPCVHVLGENSKDKESERSTRRPSYMKSDTIRQIPPNSLPSHLHHVKRKERSRPSGGHIAPRLPNQTRPPRGCRRHRLLWRTRKDRSCRDRPRQEARPLHHADTLADVLAQLPRPQRHRIGPPQLFGRRSEPHRITIPNMRQYSVRRVHFRTDP